MVIPAALCILAYQALPGTVDAILGDTKEEALSFRCALDQVIAFALAHLLALNQTVIPLPLDLRPGQLLDQPGLLGDRIMPQPARRLKRDVFDDVAVAQIAHREV